MRNQCILIAFMRFFIVAFDDNVQSIIRFSPNKRKIRLVNKLTFNHLTFVPFSFSTQISYGDFYLNVLGKKAKDKE